MNDNPYAAPKAKLADPEPGAVPERPWSVIRAVQLLWFTFALNVVATLMVAFLPQPGASTATKVVSTTVNLLVQFGLCWWFYGAAWKGRGWSRWVQAILGILALMFVYMAKKMYPALFALPWYLEGLSNLATLINAIGVGMLFAPSSNAWYRATRAERARSA
jgi:hypothetical protein